MSKIQELQEEIKRLKDLENEELMAKYNHLVGVCLHRAHTSYEKITAISHVDVDKIGVEVHFDCVGVYYDNRGDDYNSDAYIRLLRYGCIHEDDIEDAIITQEQFEEAFISCFDFIKRKTFKNIN